jgi:hypothetical protein
MTENVYPNIASAHKGILRAVLRDGTEISLGEGPSIGANRKTFDLSNYQVQVSNPIQRMLPRESTFDLVRGLARFLWLASGNDRLSDIEVYDPGAARFSDDGLRIPGSNFGLRLFCPRPGLNPIARLIGLLEREPTSRRGSVPIFFPEDVGRESKDIPCALAIHFRLDESRLCMTVVMRSNNGFRLFPYNGFEFSMLQEVIARHLRVEVGTYVHYAISMHVYSEDVALARAYSEQPPIVSLSEFALMPASPRPLEQIIAMAILETKLRNAFAFGGRKAAGDVLAQAADSLCGYWHAYFLRLALPLSTKSGDLESAAGIEAKLSKLSLYPFDSLPAVVDEATA